MLGPVLVLEPVRSDFAFGQINIALMALVIADCLDALPRRLRGIGIGIAAGIKITPAAFGLVLLLRRDGVGMAGAGRVRYGAHEFSRNQALTGLVARLGADGAVKDVLRLLVAAIVAAAVLADRRFTRSGMYVVATAVIALAAVLAAPLAVTHHWTYVVF